MTREQLSGWLDAYERAWRLAGTDALAGLFTKDATYSTGPYENPHRGLGANARMWEAERLGPGEDFEMRREIVAVESDRGVVRVQVRYGEPKGSEYRDLWIVGLDSSGRCFHFEEWPFWPPDQEGGAAAGAPG